MLSPALAGSRFDLKKLQTIPIGKTFFYACVFISTLSLAVGFGLEMRWFEVGITILCGAGWLTAQKFPASGLPLVCLLGSICLAVAGLLMRVTPLLMVLASGLSLGAWDLLCLDASLGEYSTDGQTRQYANSHSQSLALALGSGLLVAGLGHIIKIKIPFFGLALLAILILLAMDRFWGIIKKKNILR
jgi:hypothetical protein